MSAKKSVGPVAEEDAGGKPSRAISNSSTPATRGVSSVGFASSEVFGLSRGMNASNNDGFPSAGTWDSGSDALFSKI